MKFIVKGSNGTYFREWTGIGPRFGATQSKAFRFATGPDAIVTTSHYAFVGSVIEVAPESRSDCCSVEIADGSGCRCNRVAVVLCRGGETRCRQHAKGSLA